MPDPYDVLTIAAIVDELSATLGNGRIQRIGLIDTRSLGAEVYAGGRRHYLVASASDRSPRLRLAAEMPSLDPALRTPFGLLLRKYARGGVILGIDQPPLERLVRVSIARRLPPLKNATPDAGAPDDEDVTDDDDAERLGTADDLSIVYTTLSIELMGRHSNLILVDDAGLIMESAKRVTPAMSRVRTVLPRQPYLPPPPPDRLDPRDASMDQLGQLLAEAPPGADLARVLVSGFRGISPLMAREIVFRAAGGDGAHAPGLAPEPSALIEAMQELLEPLQTSSWRPHVYRAPEDAASAGAEPGPVVAFAPIPMAHLAAEFAGEPVASISAAAAMAEDAPQGASATRHAQRRQRLLDAVTAARERAERRLAALAGQASRAAEAERLKTSGELIYAYLWQITPGQTELVVDGERISLDPALSPNENAQAYFERYRKAQSASAQLPELEAEGRSEIAYLDQLATLIAQAPGFNELEALAAEWAEHAAPESARPPRRKAAPRRPQALVDAEGNSVFVGRSGPQNDLLTFEIAAPDDTWLHARGVGGSHVIIRWRNPGAEEVPATVEAAAALAAWYSAARESGRVEVDVARRRHVRKIKGAGPGMVTYRNERTVRVQPAPEERLRDILRER